jgi:hypothetical protein
VGGFVLHRYSSLQGDATPPSAALDVFALKGLSPSVTLRGDGFALHLFNKSIAPIDNVHQEGTDFAAASGTLSYRGDFGQPGLRRLLDDVRKERLDWSEIEGNYVLMLHTGGRLSLVTDPTGLYPVYCDRDRGVFSNSFLAVARHARTRTPNLQEIREYVFGAGFYGESTLLAEVQRLDSLRQWHIEPEFESQPRPWVPNTSPVGRSFDDLVEEISSALLEYFRRLERGFGDRVCASLSGGYDSRLVLALLRRAGVRPYLFVYGTETDGDVMVAKAVARHCGLVLDHIDRSRSRPSPQAVAERVNQDYAFWDGIGSEDGVFDDGSDLDTRRDRAERVRLAFNGGGGEIYRNFWQLPRWRTSIEDVIRSRFDVADFSICRNGFDRRAFRNRLTEKARVALGLDHQPPGRDQIELLYPLLRLRYWQAKNNMLDNQLSCSLTPFAEGQYAFPAAGIPINFKNHGRFEAALIARLDPELARQTSVYGHDFASPVPLRRRLRDDLRMFAPATAVGWAYRRRARTGPRSVTRRPYLREPEYLGEIFGPGPLLVEEWFRLQQIQDHKVLARVLTVELLLRAH